MKKCIMVAAMLAACVAGAALNTYNGTTYHELLEVQLPTNSLDAISIYAPTNYVGAGATNYGPAVSVAALEGSAVFVLGFGKGTDLLTYTNVLYVQDSANGTTGWTNISGVTGSQTLAGAAKFVEVAVDADAVKDYARVYYQLGGTGVWSVAVTTENAGNQTFTGTATDTVTKKGIGTWLYTMSGGPVAAAVGVIRLQTSATGTSAWSNVSGCVITNTGTSATSAAVSVDTGANERYYRSMFATTNGQQAAGAVLALPD